MFHEGQQIGPYTLIRKLGKGGFGEVWLAERRSQFLTKKVAVKLLHGDQVNFETIQREAVLWEEASGHPNVLPIIDADAYDDQVVIVSEYADGGSLSDKLLAEGKPPIRESVELTVGILKGLEFLHRKKIIHRDIKPQNILLQDNTPRLADFGISRAMQTNAISSTIIGTDAYMSPEAFDGKRSVQTDIWSVGVVLYQLLNGSLPFPQEHPSERMFAVLTKEFEPLPAEIPGGLREIVQTALAKLPENRFKSAAAMSEELQKALVSIDHPTFAKTEVLSQPLIPDFQTQDAQAIKTHEPVFPTKQTEMPTVQMAMPPEQQTQNAVEATQPAIHSNLPAETPSIVTQFKPHQAFAANKTSTLKKNPALYYAGAGIVGLLLLVGFIAVVISNRSSRSQLTNSANTTNASNSTTTIAENVQLVPFRKGEKFGFSDANKSLIIEAKYDEAKPFENSLAIVKRDGKYGFIDRSGKEIIPPKYDYLGEFYKVGLAYASIGGYPNSKCGYIDRNGNEVIPIINKSCGDFSEDLAELRVNDKDKAGYIDKTGAFVIQPQFVWGKSFSDGLAAVNLDGKHGFIDKTGKFIIQPKYDYTESFSEGLALVNFGFKNVFDSGKWGFIDKTGKIVIKIEYDHASSFSEDWAAAEIADKEGFIDKTGKTVIALKYGDVNSFSEGLAYARFSEAENGSYKYGFIDKTEKVVIPFKYQTVESFENGFAKVTLNKKEFYIGKDGTEYYEP